MPEQGWTVTQRAPYLLFLGDAARCIRVSVNTAALDGAAARDHLRDTEDKLGLPCVDPVRSRVGPIVDHLPR